VLLTSLAWSTPASAQERYRGPRLRAGLSGVGGGFVGAVHGGLGGIEPRIGLQISDMFAVLIQGQGLIGQFAPNGDDRVAGFAFHSAMFELTAGDMFQLAAGPSLDFVWGCSESRDQVACSRGGAYVGANFRAAIIVGGRHDTGWRDGFTISVDAHPTLLDDGEWSTVLLLGLGVDLY
jgi:hypothetical protein